MKYKACSFTGHRQIASGCIAPLTALLDRAVNYVYENGARDFYAGGALGFDTLAAEAVLRLREKYPDVRLHLVLPCKNQTDRWSVRDKRKYLDILAATDSYEFMFESYYDGCMKVRNERLASLCDVLIAYAGRPYGGSMQTVRLAAGRGAEVFNLYGKT